MMSIIKNTLTAIKKKKMFQDSLYKVCNNFETMFAIYNVEN